MNLSDIFPIDLIRAKFPDKKIIVESAGIDKIQWLAKTQPHTLNCVAASVLNRCIENDWGKFHPQKLIDRVEAKDPYLYQGLSKLLKEAAIKDIFWVRVTLDDPDLKNKEVAEIMLADVYPNGVELGDIMFQDPYFPMPEGMPRLPHQEYQGLGLLVEVMERLKKYAAERGFDQITLTTASPMQVPIFQKHGFCVSDDELVKGILARGHGVPMVIDLAD